MFRQLFFGGRPRRSKLVGLLLVGIAAAVLAGAGCAAGPAAPEKAPAAEVPEQTGAAETIELKLAHFWPSAHQIETQFVPGWAKVIEEETNGRVKLTSYPGETLLKAAEIYDGVVTGIADIGISCYSYTRGRFPVMEVFELPGITYNNARVSSRTAWDAMKTINPAELQDTKHLMIFSTGPGVLMTKTPVQKLSDLEGMEIRATGVSAETIKLLGATPVAMPQSESYEALSKGVVKGNLAPLETLKGWKFAEVVDYVTDAPFLYNTLFFVVMNQNKWDSLPADIRQAIEDSTSRYYEETGMGFFDPINEEGKKFAEEHNVQFFSLSDEEKALWIERLQPLLDDYVARMQELNLPGDEYVETAKKLSEQFNEQYK